MKILVAIFLVGLSVGQRYAEATGACSTERVPSGNCQLIAECKHLELEVKTLPITDFIQWYGGCGRDGDGNLRVCCPNDVVFPGDPTCPIPSRRIPGLGCVTPVNERLTWTEARDNCRRTKTRLLQGITTESQLRQLKYNFDGVLDFPLEFHDVWIGLYESKWAEPGAPSRVPSHFWYPGMPKGGQYKCGYVALQMDVPAFWETLCPDAALPSLCQAVQGIDVDIRTGSGSSSSCDPPSKTVEGLGCIRPVADQLIWTEARDNCQALGGRLLSGLTTQEQLRQIKTHFEGAFGSSLEYNDVWLGLYRGEWLGEEGKKPPGNFWYPGQPKGGNFECGYVALQMETPTLWDTVCSEASLPSLCQVSGN
ncbi:uncharacterized protein LOC135197245 [Macrobrachium nipponense]|uniref:uncharacterized protein LOC135197245 n=1 Tax=Macrobrachium nipponense TaxID=159736 RepID=UPI0030C7C016